MSRAMILMMMTLRMAMRRMTVMVMGSGTLPILIHASRKSSGTDSEFTREEKNVEEDLNFDQSFLIFIIYREGMSKYSTILDLIISVWILIAPVIILLRN